MLKSSQKQTTHGLTPGRQVGVCLKQLPSPNPDASKPSSRWHDGNVPWQRVINARGSISPRYDRFQIMSWTSLSDCLGTNVNEEVRMVQVVKQPLSELKACTWSKGTWESTRLISLRMAGSQMNSRAKRQSQVPTTTSWKWSQMKRPEATIMRTMRNLNRFLMVPFRIQVTSRNF